MEQKEYGGSSSRNIYISEYKHYNQEHHHHVQIPNNKSSVEQAAWVYNKQPKYLAHENQITHPVHMAHAHKWAHKVKDCFKTGRVDMYGPRTLGGVSAPCTAKTKTDIPVEIEAEKSLKRSKAKRWDDASNYSSSDDE